MSKTDLSPEQMLAYMTEAVEECERLRGRAAIEAEFAAEVLDAMKTWDRSIKVRIGRQCDKKFIIKVVKAYGNRQKSLPNA